MWWGLAWGATFEAFQHKTLGADQTAVIEGRMTVRLDGAEADQVATFLNVDNFKDQESQFQELTHEFTFTWKQKASGAGRRENISLKTTDQHVQYQETVRVKAWAASGVPAQSAKAVSDLLRGRPWQWQPASTVTFRVTFPGRVLETNGRPLEDPRSVEWTVRYDHAAPVVMRAVYEKPGVQSKAQLLAVLGQRNQAKAQERYAEKVTGAAVPRPQQVQQVQQEKDSSPDVAQGENVSGPLSRRLDMWQWINKGVQATPLLEALGIVVGEEGVVTVGDLASTLVADSAPVWYQVKVVKGSEADQRGVPDQSIIVGARVQIGSSWSALKTETFLQELNQYLQKGYPIQLMVVDKSEENESKEKDKKRDEGEIQKVELGESIPIKPKPVKFFPPAPLGIHMGSWQALKVKVSVEGVDSLDGGIPVTYVYPGSLAMRLGLQTADVICAWRVPGDQKWQLLRDGAALRERVVEFHTAKSQIELLVVRLEPGGYKSRVVRADWSRQPSESR